MFETWATDNDTFSTNPSWPGPDEPKKLQASVLASMTTAQHDPIDVPCVAATKLAAAVGGFPTSGTPTPCIAEEVKRNRPQFDYIVKNHLNTQTGLTAAFKRSFKVAMPTTAISVAHSLFGRWGSRLFSFLYCRRFEIPCRVLLLSVVGTVAAT